MNILTDKAPPDATTAIAIRIRKVAASDFTSWAFPGVKYHPAIVARKQEAQQCNKSHEPLEKKGRRPQCK